MIHVYLAGPILGLTENEAKGWRAEVAGMLGYGIKAVSPLRSEPIVGKTYQMGYDDPLFGLSGAIRAKNVIDTNRCDVVLAYMPKLAEGQRPSYGTVAEIGMAIALSKPLIVVAEDPIAKKHPLVGDAADWNLDTLAQAAELINATWGVYV